MTKAEAEAYVAGCAEDEGPESYDEAAEIFAAIFGRRPDQSDGDQMDLWSAACAAAGDGSAFRACYLLSADRQGTVLLTSREHAELSDDELRAEARAEMERAGLTLGGGTLEVGDWRE